MASVFQRKSKTNPKKKRWVIQWYDQHGVRREKSYKGLDKQSALRAARKLDEGVSLRRAGVIQPELDGYAEHGKRPLSQHVTEFLGFLSHKGCHKRRIQMLKKQLERAFDDIKASRLAHLEINRVQRHLQRLQTMPVTQLRETDKPKRNIGPRTVNEVRGAIIRFLNWCVETERIPRNPCKHLPKADESKDRRVKRRSLSPAELRRLVEVSGARGDVYLVAALTGLRMNELRQINWNDVDFEKGSLRVRDTISKAKRTDEIALTSEVIEVLRRRKPESVFGLDHVFPSIPIVRTFLGDLKKASIPEFDDEGRRVDRHALRMTTATLLVRAGVMPQDLQRQMRHAEIKTTLRHYVDLRLEDQKKAAAKLPQIMADQRPVLAPTGTDGMATSMIVGPQHWPQQLGCDPMRSDAV